MSRRKQANPAKLGESDATTETVEEDGCRSNKEDCPTKLIEILKSEREDYNEDELLNDDDVDMDIKDELNDEEEDDDGSLLNGQGSSPSISSEQASPASSCQSSLSDAAEAEESFTMGATATTPYECNVCKRAYARSSLLSKHVQIHTEQLQFKCPYCQRLFKHKRSRDRHTKLHTGDKKYRCHHCDSAFARSDHLKIHLKTHDNKKPHQCELCNRGYNTAAALASHQQHHSKQEQKRCGSSASQSSVVRTPSPVFFRCIFCPESFEKATLLQEHIMINHKNNLTTPTHIKQPKQFIMDPNSPILKSAIDMPKIACMYCGKDFLSMEHMYQHIQVDHRAFLNASAQNMNYTPLQSPSVVEDLSPKQTRQNNSPTYACDKCTMKFDSSILLHEHNQNVHWGATHSFKYEFNPLNSNISLDKIQSSAPQSKPTDLSRKRRSTGNSPESEKRKSDDTALLKETSPSTGSPYEANDRPCICAYCYAQMPNFKLFLAHMENHVAMNPAGNNIVGCCPLCGEAATSALELGRHIYNHAITNVTTKCCGSCKQPFEQDDQLQRHLIQVHSQAYYKCTICNMMFDSEYNLQAHFSVTHNNDCRHYRCTLCTNQIFHDKFTAELHVNMKHNIRAPAGGTNAQNYPLQRMPMGSDVALFQCPFCRRSFQTEYTLYMHMLQEHNNPREGDNSREGTASGGPTVPQNFHTYNVLISPPENLDLKGGYNCEICNRTDISSEAELAAHKKLHHAKSKVGTVSLQCAYCKEHCKSRSDLDNHMKTHQIACGKGKHKCNICDDIFGSNDALAEHKLAHCKIIAGNSCTHCKTLLYDEQSFYNHQLHHSNTSAVNKSSSQISLPANCIICCQTLQTDVEIKLHAKFHLRHLIKKELVCVICSKVLGAHDPNDLRPQINICNECINAKGTFTTLEGEDQTRDPELSLNDVLNLQCNLCQFRFSSTAKLQIHMIEHNFMGMGQFQCYICSSIFTTAVGLQSHIITHGLNNRPYECSLCKKKFFFETELENHKMRHYLPKKHNGITQVVPTIYHKYMLCDKCELTFPEILFNKHSMECKAVPKNNETGTSVTGNALDVKDNNEEISVKDAENTNEPDKA